MVKLYIYRQAGRLYIYTLQATEINLSLIVLINTDHPPPGKVPCADVSTTTTRNN